MERELEYQKLIDKYSKAYYRKVSDLFSLEDIAQEMWVALLKAEQAGGFQALNDASKLTYLTHCVRNKFHNLIVREIQKKRTITESIDTVNDEEYEGNADTPDDLLFFKELYDNVQLKVRKIKNGQFVLDRIHLTTREISRQGKLEGLQLSKSNVAVKKNQIKKIMDKMLS